MAAAVHDHESIDVIHLVRVMPGPPRQYGLLRDEVSTLPYCGEGRERCTALLCKRSMKLSKNQPLHSKSIHTGSLTQSRKGECPIT